MHARHRWLLLLSAISLLTFALTGDAQTPNKKSLDRRELDKRIYTTLRDVINAGADLYNPPVGDRTGCYHLYEGALLTVRPLLDHRPQLQKDIDEGLTKAQGLRSPGEQAFALRAILDGIRDQVRPPGTKVPTDTLWVRLGGEAGVAKIVDDLVATAASDPKVNFFRSGKYKPDAAQVADMKKKLVEMISEASGGPLKYTGKGMKEVHQGMGITDAEFDALAADLKAALESNGVKPDDVAAVLKAVDGTRKDIVEKKSDEKKPDPKKADEKKAAVAETKPNQVKGRITLQGMPLVGVVVTFVAADGSAPKGATAMTAADGTFEIKDELKPGAYRITITEGNSKVKVPPQYGKPETALIVGIKKEGNELDIKLTP